MRRFKNIYELIPLESQVWRNKASCYKKLIIEIGAGAGYHAIQNAKAHSDNFIVAIERTQVKSQKMIGRVKHHPELKNIYPVCGDAIPWICQQCLPEEVDNYIVLYPNPYPKASQANKRFINMPFMEKLIETLKPGGTILFATNIEAQYREIKTVGENVWHLSVVDNLQLPADFEPRSHFEKKYLERGESCYQVVFLKS